MTPTHWMITAGGQDYRLSGPTVLLGNAPAIRDIAHHLAQINRFTGACSRPYSVAEHSMLVERIGHARGASPVLRLALLMHDAHEAFTSDLSSPSKQVLGNAWRSFEVVHALNVRDHFHLRSTFAGRSAEIRTCDLIALATERRDLIAFDPAVNTPWPILDTPGAEVLPAAEVIPADEPPLSWRDMRQAFINRYLLLRELVSEQARQLGAPSVEATLA